MTALKVARVLPKTARLALLKRADTLVVKGAQETTFFRGTHTVAWQAVKQILQGCILGGCTLARGGFAFTLGAFVAFAFLAFAFGPFDSFDTKGVTHAITSGLHEADATNESRGGAVPGFMFRWPRDSWATQRHSF